MQSDQPHRPRKRFGQNFLHDGNIIRQILAAAELTREDRVLEIGPGLGALTDLLLAEAGQVEVMEVDRDLVSRLEKRGDQHLTIHAGDALQMDWDALLLVPPYKLVANLPYNISSQILFKVLEHRQLFCLLVLMFQKEVGDRLCAVPGTKDYGILSVLIQLWFDIRRVVRVPPGAFHPPPKVQSVVLAFDPLPASRVVVEDERYFVRVVKGAFGQRRKTLRNALQSAGWDAATLDTALQQADIDPQRRGETLNLQEFATLTRCLKRAEANL